MDVLLLRFDAPLMSFGGVVVDNHGVTRAFPGRAMLAGLCANALGWDHRDADRTTALQSRLRYAAREDWRGTEIVDYQTVDLGQPFLAEGWTTRGAPEGRKGGEAKKSTHIRYRHFLANAVYTVALALERPDEPPDLGTLAAAIASPERPLFLGRKCCLPARPLVLRTVRAEGVLAALEVEPRATRATRATPAPERLRAWWPADEGARRDARAIAVTDDRDWVNQVHVGRRFLWEGTIGPVPAATAREEVGT
jgi:CRISPR system Cascade subunit CasD